MPAKLTETLHAKHGQVLAKLGGHDQMFCAFWPDRIQFDMINPLKVRCDIHFIV
jgi:hypothetical protein